MNGSPPLARIPLARTTLILGGARSGKSRYAEELIEAVGKGLYLATAEALPDDREMAARIIDHQTRRGNIWQTIEEPLRIANIINRHTQMDRPILVDCLTLWLSNLMFDKQDVDVATGELIDALGQSSGPVVLVSNEVGLGIVPDNALAREFRDQAGRMNQSIAAVCQRVVFMAAGLPMIMKDESQ